MIAYQIKSIKLAGTKYSEVNKKAHTIFKNIQRKTKRRTYVRSKYFNKEKIFLDLFWQHLHDKLNHRDKTRRLKFFPCALELIIHSHLEPSSKENPNTKSEILHRFGGITKNKEIFIVQIKEDKQTGEKFFMSVFPL